MQLLLTSGRGVVPHHHHHLVRLSRRHRLQTYVSSRAMATQSSPSLLRQRHLWTCASTVTTTRAAHPIPPPNTTTSTIPTRSTTISQRHHSTMSTMINDNNNNNTTTNSSSSSSTPSADNIVWIDLEMTGLDLSKDQIMEIAVIVTDEQLNVVAEMEDSLVVHMTDEALSGMNAWCTEHHGASGLTERCRQSTMTIAEVEDRVLQFVRQYCTESSCPLAGNSVYVDRMFLKKEMPRLDRFLHYRIIDVSSFKECIRRWYPQRFASTPPKKGVHRAVDDIRESIEELRYYREHFMIKE